MKEYTVRVTETNAWNIKIQAEDEDQAAGGDQEEEDFPPAEFHDTDFSIAIRAVTVRERFLAD